MKATSQSALAILVLATALGTQVQAQSEEERADIVGVLQGDPPQSEAKPESEAKAECSGSTASETAQTPLGKIFSSAKQRGTLQRVLGKRTYWVGPKGYSLVHRAPSLVTVEGSRSGETLRFVTTFHYDDTRGVRQVDMKLDYAYGLEGNLRSLQVSGEFVGEPFEVMWRVEGDQLLSTSGQRTLAWDPLAIPFSVAALVLPSLYEDLPQALSYPYFDGEDGLESEAWKLAVGDASSALPDRPRSIYFGSGSALNTIAKVDPGTGRLTTLVREDEVWRLLTPAQAKRQQGRCRPDGPLGTTGDDDPRRHETKRVLDRQAKQRFAGEARLYTYYLERAQQK